MPKRSDLTTVAQEMERDLRAIREIIRRPLEPAVARGNLTGPQQSAMQILVGTDGMSLKELSVQLGLAHSTVSGIVDRLEKRGLIERQAGDKDRRLTRIVVTRAVRDFARNTIPKLSAHPLAEALRRARPTDRRCVIEGVRMLRKILETKNLR
jgi:DNA-binding MarR family transcriptional regulator